MQRARIGPAWGSAISGCRRAAPSSRRWVSSDKVARTATAAHRPSFAPKPVLELKRFREDPDAVRENCKRRNLYKQALHGHRLAELHQESLTLTQQATEIRSKNRAIKEKLRHLSTVESTTGEKAATEDEREAILAQAKALKEWLREHEPREAAIAAEAEALALEIPNWTSSSTPLDDKYRVIGFVNHDRLPMEQKRQHQKSHVQIGQELELINFTAASATSGFGFYYLANDAVLLEQALIQYAMRVAQSQGFTAVTPPSLVFDHIAAACGFAPRDQGNETQIYRVARLPDQGYGRCLAGTAEIPLAALHADTTLAKEDLPLKVVGSSRCYRAEAGAHGTAAKGLYRVHEFNKVEMFGWTAPNEPAATELLDTMVRVQKEIFRNLGLRCRVLEQPSSDLGASASRKIDIEALFPSRHGHHNGGWGEVSSASICTDFQSRRLATRTWNAAESKLGFPYTVNGTAMAVPRVLAAILEMGWQASTQTVIIPRILRDFMGKEVISKPSPESVGRLPGFRKPRFVNPPPISLGTVGSSGRSFESPSQWVEDGAELDEKDD